jgi:hypothetical protein
MKAFCILATLCVYLIVLMTYCGVLSCHCGVALTERTHFLFKFSAKGLDLFTALVLKAGHDCGDVCKTDAFAFGCFLGYDLCCSELTLGSLHRKSLRRERVHNGLYL